MKNLQKTIKQMKAELTRITSQTSYISSSNIKRVCYTNWCENRIEKQRLLEARIDHLEERSMFY